MTSPSILSDYKIVIVVDDGVQAVDVVSRAKGFVPQLLEYNDSLSLYFTGGRNPVHNIKTATDFNNLVVPRPSGDRSLAQTLQDVISEYRDQKHSVYVFTAAAEEARVDVSQVIKDHADDLTNKHREQAFAGFQFFQVGNAKGATTFLKKLDSKKKSGFSRDIVDTLEANQISSQPNKALIGSLSELDQDSE